MKDPCAISLSLFWTNWYGQIPAKAKEQGTVSQWTGPCTRSRKRGEEVIFYHCHNVVSEIFGFKTKFSNKIKKNIRFLPEENLSCGLKVVEARLSELPAWVFFPDLDRAEWVNRWKTTKVQNCLPIYYFLNMLFTQFIIYSIYYFLNIFFPQYILSSI